MVHRYHNLDPTHRPHGPAAIFRWGIWEPLVGKRKTTPAGEPAPRVPPDLDLVHESSNRPRLTWLGHAGFLGSLGGRNFVIDPLYSRRVARVYPRFGEPGLPLEELPPLTALMISHNHYDHLDTTALKGIPRRVPVVIPRGLGAWFRRWNRRPIVELGWWDSVEIGGLSITLVPARHWSRRRILDTNHSHWGGFVVSWGTDSVYHSGDSAWFNGFEEIGRRFPELLAALLPVGAYDPGWFMENNHLNPEQAGRAFIATGAQRFIPMHWGMLRLTDEKLCEPIERLRQWWELEGPRDRRELVVLSVGETLVLREAR
jgi:L-ascorbate metabolism protein UlaG (beta-lactamase superfamily)